MNVKDRKSFERDSTEIRDRATLKRIRKAIDGVKRATQLSEIPKLKKLKVGDFYWRIKTGSFRIGIAVEHEFVEFIRILNRKDFNE